MIRTFAALGLRGEPMLRNAELALVPKEYYGYNRNIRCEHTFVFAILALGEQAPAGEIALRIGDSPEQFYLGHIGYHIDPPYRGHGYAGKACRLCVPFLIDWGLRSIVITTDPGNTASVKTCLRLGCELECTVSVPAYVRDKVEISSEKHRFLWCL